MNGDVHKIVFIGAPGAGKTTCIQALSDIAPVATDVPCTDSLRAMKETTTVAMDYGELQLDDSGNRLLLYGLPGQERFNYMFDVVREGLLGAVVLVDATSRDAMDELAATLRSYHRYLKDLPFVVALNKEADGLDELKASSRDVLGRHSLIAPVTSVDARHRDDVVGLFELLLVILEFGFDHGSKELMP